MRWLYPVCVTFALVGVNVLFGATTAIIEPLQDVFPGQTLFDLNLVNFSYYFVFAAAGPFVPYVSARIARGPLLVLLMLLALAGCALQCMYAYGFGWLLAGGFVASLPQPFMIANVAVLLKEYVPERFETTFYGLFVALTDGAIAVSYLLAIWLMPTAADVVSTLRLFGYAAAGIALATAAGSLVYLVSCQTEQNEPLIALDDNARVDGFRRRNRCHCGFEDWAFWIYLFSAALCDGLGNALGLVFLQLADSEGLTEPEIAATVIAMGALSLPVPLLVGWAFDHWRQATSLLIPFAAVLVQCGAQIGVFLSGATWPWVFIALMLLFGVANAAVETAFLPALLRIQPNYERQNINALLAWMTTVFAAASSFALFNRADSSIVPQLQPLFVSVGVVTPFAMLLVMAVSLAR